MYQGPEKYEGDLRPFFEELGVSSVNELPSVPIAEEPEGLEILKLSHVRQKVPRSAPDNLIAIELVGQFKNHLTELNVQLDEAAAIDVLAAYLSSQFVLFAGPSGTGKSTVARALQSFFAPQDSQLLIYAKRQLLGPEDLSGYYSPITSQFVAGPETGGLYSLSDYDPDFASPSILVEEINLSPPEGYLNPFVHGLSGLSSPTVKWPLFPSDLEGPETGTANVVIGPFPRLLGTINVDATAPPPAPKVTARSCVILMEPQTVSDIDEVIEALRTNQLNHNSKYSGSRFVFDPLQIMQCQDVNFDELKVECLRLAAALKHGEEAFKPDWDPSTHPVDGVSRRQLSQLIVFSSWYVLLAKAADPSAANLHPRIAAENAVLHFLLPSLDATSFADGLGKLSRAKSFLTSRSISPLGGVLSERIDRLENGGEAEGYAGRLLDYWDRLS